MIANRATETAEQRQRRIAHDIAVLKIRKARRLRTLRIARVRCCR